VESVQITMAEESGARSRRFYEEVGAVRDVVRTTCFRSSPIWRWNPGRIDSDALRDERIKVFRSIRPLTARASCAASIVAIAMRRRCRDSQVETFAAMELHLDSWRWHGVPFSSGPETLPSQARSDGRAARPPQNVFREPTPPARTIFASSWPGQVSIAAGPCRAAGSRDGGECGRTARLQHGRRRAQAYERLIGDAMVGDATLFARQDGVEAAWRIVDPILS